MSYGDDNDLYISIVNLVITLLIIGLLLYMYLSYQDMKKKTTSLVGDYDKRFPSPKS